MFARVLSHPSFDFFVAILQMGELLGKELRICGVAVQSRLQSAALLLLYPLGYAMTHPCPEILCRSSPFAIASYSRPRPRSPMEIVDLGATVRHLSSRNFAAKVRDGWGISQGYEMNGWGKCSVREGVLMCLIRIGYWVWTHQRRLQRL